MSEPVFIVGCPRSGTTLLRLILTNHSQLAIPPECAFIVKLYTRWHDVLIKTDAQVESFLNDLYREQKFHDWGVEREQLRRQLADSLPLTYAESCEQIYVVYAASIQQKTLWGDKNPVYLFRLPKILALFPQAKIIHIVRDGRAVFWSGLNANRARQQQGKKPVFADSALRSYLRWREALGIGKKMRQNPNYIEVRYESLLTNSKTVMEEICLYLGLVFEPKMLTFHEQVSNGQEVPQAQRYLHNNTFRPIDPSLATKWKNALPPKLRFQYEIIGRKTLKENGYTVQLTPQHLLAFNGQLIRDIFDILNRYRQAHSLALRNKIISTFLPFTLLWKSGLFTLEFFV